MHTIPLKRLPIAAGDWALDLGCGRGRHTHGLASVTPATVIGVDLDWQDLRATQEGFAWLPGRGGWGLAQADALALPFADEAFDAVVCSEVLEHIPAVETALDEIARVVRPGGALAVSVPRAWPEALCWRLAPEYPRQPGGHVRIFNAKALRASVEDRGFALRWRGFAHGLHSPYWWLKCLLWDRRDDHPLIRAYQRFLEWDILKQPRLTRVMEALAAPVMGKSVVMGFEKTARAGS